MYFASRIRVSLSALVLFAFGMPIDLAAAEAQAVPRQSRQFMQGDVSRLEDLPQGRLRSRLNALPAPARQRGLDWLNRFHFTDHDLDSLFADAEGAIYYADDFELPVGVESEPEPEGIEPGTSEAALPVSPFPPTLIFHSKPGSPNKLFLNFAGEVITGTAWNNSVGRTEIVAVAFSKDSDYSTYSDTEQTIIKKVWQRVAEDYAPFDIDVTTERPAAFNSRTAHALITRNTDADGESNPSSGAGGVAYVNVFAGGNMDYYSPAWIYFNNLSSDESFLAEAVSHEIGHNMGLSHDGKTDGSSYYGGHGSGDISWGPIMGTGYNRNVSQWSKGEYYLANNTQDDLNTIAGKLTYRTDDHGDTAGTATPIEADASGNIVSTTPADDPDNYSPQNKGVLGPNTDVDCFAFVTGNGQVTLRVDPWIVPSGRTRGGNLDVVLELADASGVLVTTNNPSGQTYAQIQTTLTEGLYFLRVRNTGTGSPETSPPSGYTSYGSMGQYFLSGSIVPSTFAPLPMAELQVDDLRSTGQAAIQIDVIYSDNLGINVASIDSSDLVVTGPNAFSASAEFVSVSSSENGTPRVATYEIAPPQGLSEWTAEGNGIYSVWIQADEVGDVEGGWVEAGLLGTFVVDVPVLIYAANMDSDPGWSMEPLWEYGTPDYSNGNAPSSAATGTKILAYNLDGNYQNSLSAKYATTPVIDARGYKELTLNFQQWLRVRNGDTATIQISTNGVDWSNLWVSSGSTYENSWQLKQFDLPSWTDDSEALQLRWSIASSPSQSEIGWNIDDVMLTGLVESGLNSTVNLAVTINNPDWGQVTPLSNNYPAGTLVNISATPAQHFSFLQWTGDLESSENPLSVVLDNDLQLEAVFAEILTTNHSVPYWWLAEQGVVSDFESAVELTGDNGVPLWHSYVAGLNPGDAGSRFILSAEASGDGGECVLHWDPVPGRVYTVLSSPDSAGTFLPVPGAASLPDSVTSFTNVANPNLPMQFYRLEVSLP